MNHTRPSAFIDETGNRHGRLLVLEEAPYKKGRAVKWKCQCSCGNIVNVEGSMLRKGNTKSCGCLKNDLLKQYPRNIKDSGEAAFTYLLINYKRHAKQRNLCWELSEENFRELSKRNCHYCGAPPNQKIDRKLYNGAYEYNGIDRLENSIGYTYENSVACCGNCNKMKGILKQDYFLAHVKKIAEHQKLRSRRTFNMDNHKPQGKEGSPL